MMITDFELKDIPKKETAKVEKEQAAFEKLAEKVPIEEKPKTLSDFLSGRFLYGSEILQSNLSEDMTRLDKEASIDETNCYICRESDDKGSYRYYFVWGGDAESLTAFSKELEENPDRFEVYFPIPYGEYKELLKGNSISVIPNITSYDVGTTAVVADGLWQTACGLVASLVLKMEAWNIGTQLGYPAGLGLIAGAIRGYMQYKAYEKKHGEPPPPAVKKAIIKDCAAFAAKTAIAMGAWELGFFVGQCLTTALSSTPYTFWVPAALAICAGLFQGISAVVTQVADEKRKYGEVRSSVFDLGKTFVSGFASGAVWALCSFIPFGPALATTILKPVATIVGSVLAGVATGIASYVVNKLVPNVMDKVAETKKKVGNFFSSLSIFNKTSPKNGKNVEETQPFLQATVKIRLDR